MAAVVASYGSLTLFSRQCGLKLSIEKYGRGNGRGKKRSDGERRKN
jgi:hypothetical protein